MSDQYKREISYPNFSAFGYQVISELGRNQEGGRIAYLANHIKVQQKVVIKEFSLGSVVADWYGVKSYQREIQILQRLNYHRIPRYLNAFETATGFYLVLEYKNAPSLGIGHNFQPEEIKQIALSILETLVYLQQQIPPIIHRDIKPENILVDPQLNAYLVDFGLARSNDDKRELSTLVAGTPGFMPPEEYFGHTLTTASDLYSLGATLICLLTHTRAVDIGKLIDENYRFNLQKLIPNISPHFRSWLKKMVEPNQKRRYVNAAVALQTLKPIQVFSSNPRINDFVAAIDIRKNLVILGLATMGILATLGESSIISAPIDPTNSNSQLKPIFPEVTGSN